MKLYTVQPSAFTDNMWDLSGVWVEGHKLPYPFHVTEAGDIERQDFWQGQPKRVVGFAEKLDVHRVDLWWKDTLAEPEQAVGMYLITQDKDGRMHTHQTAVQSITLVEVDE
jgi:hypothetical protein